MEGIWARLEEKLEYGTFVPTPVPDIERAGLRKRDGTPYTVLKNPHGDRDGGTYVTLEQPDLELFELMDGKSSTSGILVAHLQRRGYLALDRLAKLTAVLAANGFFGEARVDAYERLFRRRALRDPLIRLSLLLRRLVMWDIAQWRNAEGAVDILYRAGGRLAFTRVGATLVLALAATGLALWAREFASPRQDLFRVGGSLAWGLAALVAAQVVSISIHEAGHALAVRHFGRRVRLLGAAIYYLLPVVYVDATDMVMAPRWQRVVVSLAGPIAGVTVAGVAMLVMVTTSDPIVAAIAFQASTLLVFAFVLNLLPVLDLDGYHVLIDALDAPLLRQRAIGFFRAGAPRKLRRREKWSASEVLLASYGGLAIAASIGMLLFAVWIWRSRIGPLAAELAGSGPLGTLTVAIVLLVFIGPIVLGLAMKIAGAGQMALRTVAARTARDEKARLIERIGVLRRVRFLANLTPQALAALADHIVVERAEPGDVVVTYGEPADKFYIVRSGQLEVIAPDGRPLHPIIPGEGLGELALLDGTPRTMTVRATQPTVLWSIDRGHFHRWIRDRYEVAARIRASEEERARLQRLPFFQHLGPQELERLAAKLVTQRVPAGEDVIRAGEPGDRYYIIREGTAEVTDSDGRPIRTLGPDQDFGELALLFGGPRTASVRALTDLVVVSLARKDFAALVQASGETHGQFRQRTAHYENAPGLGSTIARAGR